MATPIEQARRFFDGRFALVGVSRNEKDFSRYLLGELLRRGYEAVPVNPALAEIGGRPCFARVQDIEPRVDGVILLTAPAQAAQLVRDCAEAGIRRVWFHRGGGPGAASPEALALCRENGMEVVTDLCPFMAMPGASFPHRVHGFFRRAFSARARP
jgi:predicted CoA-binding protein